MAYKWSEMSPREKDVLVAKKVIGWTEFSPVDPYCDYAIGVNGFRRNYAKNPDGRFEPIPFYTTDMNATLEVLKVMVGDKYYPSIGYDEEVNQWLVWFSHNRTALDYAYSHSLSDAICNAALKAVGVEVRR